MAKIVRTATRAEGGLTKHERQLLAAHTSLWISRARRTDPIEPDKITPAIEGLYAVAGLKTPRVVIVPSPLVMAFAYGAASAIWYGRKHPEENNAATRAATRAATDAATRAATDAATRAATEAATDAATWAATEAATDAATRAATDAATRAATDAATRAATRAATDAATRAATWAATDAATRAATDAAKRACMSLADRFGLQCAQNWSANYQGGNMWAAYDCFLSACRDVLGLKLPQHVAYSFWEQAGIHGGFRVMHEEFCMVSDFPELMLQDNENRPHCETGPSHRWRDGWVLYHWHGVKVPAHWIENRATLDPVEVLKETNVELRSAGAGIIGWPRMVEHLKRKIVDGDPGTDLGALVELTLPGLSEPGRFLQAVCPRNGTIVEGVPYISDIDNKPINTVMAAQAWRDGLPASEYQHPLYRT